MATSGIPGDVDNRIFMTNAYPLGRSYGMVGQAATDFSMRNNYAGEIGGLNQDYTGMIATNASQVETNGGRAMMNDNGKKPAMWFLTFAIVFVLVAWAARKFAPDGEQFAIVKPNLINGIFLTLWTILIIVFLKQVAIRLKPIPGVRALADLILSV